MPTGARDFQQGQNAGTPGDLASRLIAGAGAYHPTGTWGFFDDFEGATPLVKWQQTITGGGSIAIDTTAAYRGTACAKMVTGALISAQSAISKIMPITTDRVGIDFMVNMVPAGGTSVIGIQANLFLNLGAGIRQIQAAVALNYTGSNGLTSIQLISDVGPNPVIASGQNISWVAGRWHNYKMIFNIATGLYEAFFFDNFTYNINGLTPSQQGNAIQQDVGQYMQPQVLISTAAAVAETARFDDVIVTFNES